MVSGRYLVFTYLDPYPEALRTHVLRLLDPKTILYKVYGPF